MTLLVIIQPVGSVYVMVTMPKPLPPVTMPVAEPIVAIEVLPLLHVPMKLLSINCAERPAQTLKAPVMGAGNESTVTKVVERQPGASE